jgi:hypothetical protein
VLVHWSYSTPIDMSPHSDKLSWFLDNQSLFLPLNVAYLEEKQQIPIWQSLVSSDQGSNPWSTTLKAQTHDLPHSRLKPMIYRTQGSNPWSTALKAQTHDLPHSRLKPMIYRTQGEHTNHYPIRRFLNAPTNSCVFFHQYIWSTFRSNTYLCQRNAVIPWPQKDI